MKNLNLFGAGWCLAFTLAEIIQGHGLFALVDFLVFLFNIISFLLSVNTTIVICKKCNKSAESIWRLLAEHGNCK